MQTSAMERQGLLKSLKIGAIPRLLLGFGGELIRFGGFI